MSNYDYTLYTDGSCQSNPGPGGWAYVLISGQKEERFCGGTRVTTNNRMELTAVIRGLTRVPEGSSVAVYSDAQYVTNAFNKGWIHNWKRLGWNNGSGTLKNTELWKNLDGLVKARNVTFVWVKGHNGNKYNEICDEAANAVSERYRQLVEKEALSPETKEKTTSEQVELEQSSLFDSMPVMQDDSSFVQESINHTDEMKEAIASVDTKELDMAYSALEHLLHLTIFRSRPHICGSKSFCDFCGGDIDFPCAKAYTEEQRNLGTIGKEEAAV